MGRVTRGRHGDGHDGHLRSEDFLAVEKHPETTFRSTGLTAATGTDRWTVHGELGMRGVVRPVDLDLAYLGTGADPWGGPARPSGRPRNCTATTSP
jgi:polyisoprenoid-binding protein YceI